MTQKIGNISKDQLGKLQLAHVRITLAREVQDAMWATIEHFVDRTYGARLEQDFMLSSDGKTITSTDDTLVYDLSGMLDIEKEFLQECRDLHQVAKNLHAEIWGEFYTQFKLDPKGQYTVDASKLLLSYAD